MDNNEPKRDDNANAGLVEVKVGDQMMMMTPEEKAAYMKEKMEGGFDDKA